MGVSAHVGLFETHRVQVLIKVSSFVLLKVGLTSSTGLTLLDIAASLKGLTVRVIQSVGGDFQELLASTCHVPGTERS